MQITRLLVIYLIEMALYQEIDLGWVAPNSSANNILTNYDAPRLRFGREKCVKIDATCDGISFYHEFDLCT